MRILGFSRYALTSCAAAALLAGCGGGQPPIDAQSSVSAISLSVSHHRTFNYTGTRQAFTVPSTVTKLQVVALGGTGAASAGSKLGYGGRVFALIPVTPHERLTIYVGGNGIGHSGGYNGGGAGSQIGYGDSYGFGGGGATDVREGGDTLNDRILVVGGGGGQGAKAYTNYGVGGKGGGSIAGHGGRGDYYVSLGGGGGRGGSQKRGGRGGRHGSGSYGGGGTGANGSLGTGGDGGPGGGVYSGYLGAGGGGGGGGYYGGGGGGGGGANNYGGGTGGGGGGGGGSSYIEPSAFKFQSWRGWKSPAHGLVVLSW